MTPKVKARKALWTGAAAIALIVAACAEFGTEGGVEQEESGGQADQSADQNSPPTPPPSPEPAAEMAGLRVTAASMGGPQSFPQPRPGDIDRERYEDADPNPVVATAEEPVSTFSIDVDTASYAVARRYLNDGVLPPRDAIRPEEVINYFEYDYPLPDNSDQPFAADVTVTPNPWNADTQLMHVGIQGYDVIPEEQPRANLVFLIDVSGSMSSDDKLPLALQGLRMLLGELDEDDTVAIAVYAGAAGVVLEPTPVSERQTILAALDRLEAGGSTAGGEGLRLAYSLAEQNLDEDAVNRVMLVTDGDFNVGITQDERLEDFVARKRESGVYLSVMGFGRGNYNDRLMQTIAQAGDGTAAYVDTLQEARRVLVEEASSTLFPIADDVKIQVEFNPARVAEYRLIGYETRMLERADFSNDAVDAGEIGSGHSVTAIYEIVPPDSPARLLEPLRYEAEPQPVDSSGEIAFLRIRHKRPGEDESRLYEHPVTDLDAVSDFADADQEVRFAVAAAAYAQLLRGDPYLNDFGFSDVVEIAQAARGEDPFGYRAEFVQLARLAETAAAQERLHRPGRGE
ncbi:VWA domain-containing protein [Marinicauda salina]|uniref:VWA domain-containing protein n=1 Tax=Marinicauda salina TaxID=2135793 RepID=A0A2U2BU49_9PROT|nr:VWA domain-containing protein [Marinicauda salina]PWE17504.1 VWA domain-containing protein [Marinicauda salina]